MKTETHTFNIPGGEATVVLDIFEMDACEAIDVYDRDPGRFEHGGWRIEGTINGMPRGTRFYSPMYDSKYRGGDSRVAAIQFLKLAMVEGFFKNKPRVVVCAATLLITEGHDSVVLLGARHWDQSMHNQLSCQEEYFDKADETQGFIDQFGVFMTREEAFEVATAAGQIKYRCGGDEGVLFSENLY